MILVAEMIRFVEKALVSLMIGHRRLNSAVSTKTSRVSAFICPHTAPKHLAAVADVPLGQLAELMLSYTISYSEIFRGFCEAEIPKGVDESAERSNGLKSDRGTEYKDVREQSRKSYMESRA